MGRWYIFIFAFIVLTYSFIPSCYNAGSNVLNPASSNKTPLKNETTTLLIYKNENLGYLINYPTDWEIEEKIYSEHTYVTSLLSPKPHLGSIQIWVEDKTTLPLDVVTNIKIRSMNEHNTNVVLLKNQSMSNEWDWYLSYEYNYEKFGDFKGESFFKKAGDRIYEIDWECNKDSLILFNFNEIISTFEILNIQTNIIHYKNNQFDYTIDYPTTWKINTERSDNVDISPISPKWFVDLSIIIRQSNNLRPVSEIASGYIEAYSELKNGNVKVINNEPQTTNQWDWLVTLEYPIKEIYATEFTFFKLDTDRLCEFHMAWDSAQKEMIKQEYLDDMMYILDSFTLY